MTIATIVPHPSDDPSMADCTYLQCDTFQEAHSLIDMLEDTYPHQIFMRSTRYAAPVIVITPDTTN